MGRRGVGVLFGVLSIGALPAAAEGDGPVVDGPSGTLEVVVVTGAWIPGTPEDAPLPVTRITRDELREEGSPGLVDMLRNLSFSQGADGESDQYGSRTGADRATVNLRGLGPSRSLVLLNGQRMPFSPGSIPDQAQLVVDVNLLPEAAFERIEVLREGAAATYGSDAIAGVVNFITREDFEGIEGEVRHRTISGSDGDSRVSLVAGRAFGAGAGHLVTSIGFADRAPLAMGERAWAVRPHADNPRGGWTGTGRPGLFVPLQGFAATPGDGGSMQRVGIVDPNCESVGGAHTNVPAGRPRGGLCRFQYTAFANLVQATRRWQWFTEGSWEFAGGVRLSGELLVADTEVPSWRTSPSYPPSEVIDLSRVIQASNPALVDMASKHPHLYGDYASCAQEYCRWTGDGGAQDAAGVPPAWQDVAWINGRHYGQEGPVRGYPRRSATERAVVRVEGDWGSTSWSAALTLAEARRLEEDGDGLDYRSVRAHLGLGGYECEALVPNRYDTDGRLDFDWETLRDHAGQGPCGYWVPFSNGLEPHVRVREASNPDYEPELDHRGLADYLIMARGFKGRTSLHMLEGLVNGDSPWQLGGGPVAYALGAQVRREYYRRREYSEETGPRGGALQDLQRYPCRGGPSITDCVAGRTGVFIYLPPGYDAEADRTIYAVFGEAALPVTDDLNAQLSLRYEHYDQQGLSSLDPRLALRWQVLPAVALRASAGTAFRAPTLNQVEAGIATTSRQFIGRIGTFKPIRALGNPALEPEMVSTFNAGAILDREHWLTVGDRLYARADYWRYAFEEPLVLEPYVRVLDLACPRDDSFCDAQSEYFGRVHFGGRSAVSDISAISVRVVNGPDVDTQGVDLSVEYSAPMAWGEWTLGVAGTRTLSWEIDGWEFGPAYDAIGRLNYDTPLARTVLDWKARAWVNLRARDLNVRWTVHHTAAYAHDLPTEPEIDAHTTHDVTIFWTSPDESWTVDATVWNATDRDPPRVYRQLNYDPLAHNPLGRMFELGLRRRL